MPPGLGEGAREEGVLWRGGLESGALGSRELDPVKVTVAWLFMRAEHVGRRSRVLGGGGGGREGWRGQTQEWGFRRSMVKEKPKA